MSDFVKAYRGKSERATVYEDIRGPAIIKKDGSPAWRNNNPGNIEKGSFSDRYGAIGDDGRFAVFPNYEAGKQAVKGLFQTKTYGDLSLADAVNRYAPKSENDTEAYVNFIETQSGIERTKRVGSLSPTELESLAKSIERFEGHIVGQVIPVPRRKPERDATGRMIRDQ